MNFKKMAFGLTFVIGVFFFYVALQPSEMNIAREIFIKAPPESIFTYINSSKKSNDWMPWTELDPKVQMAFSGPEEGVGATTSWESEGQMGVGRAEVVESTPLQVVKTKLVYTKPMEMSQLAEVSLTPTGEGTIVRWQVTGKNSFVGRFFCVFMDMDKEVGGNFERGLSKLKSIVETSPKGM